MFRASLFAVLTSVSALAQERVRVAVHPIVAPGVDDPKLVADLNREVQVILAETKRVVLVAPEDVEKRLAEEGGKCPPRGKERTDCLERVALATRAVYIVAVTVKRLGKEYELAATIADADRVLLEQPDPVTVTDNGAVKIDAALKHQLRVLLLERMKADVLPVDPRLRNRAPPVVVVNPPPVIVKDVPPPPPPEEKPEPGMSTLRIGSLVAGGFALVAGSVAVGLAVSAKGQADKLTVSDGVLLGRDQLGQLQSSRNQASIAAAMGAVAGVAALGAVLMFVFAPAEEPVATVAPVAFVGGGGGLAVSGVLP